MKVKRFCFDPNRSAISDENVAKSWHTGEERMKERKKRAANSSTEKSVGNFLRKQKGS